MELLKYVNSAIFIDDKFDEVENIIGFFEKSNVWTKYINPLDIVEDDIFDFTGLRLIFLDIQYQAGSQDTVWAVNTLKKVCGENIGNVILVIWSNNEPLIPTLLNQIDEKMEGKKPILIVNAEKSRINNLSGDAFDTAITSILEQHIESNPLAYSLLQWENQVKRATQKTFNDICQFAYDSDSHDFNLDKALSLFTLSTVEPSKLSSALSVANELLIDNIKNNVSTVPDSNLAWDTNQTTQEDKGQLNFLHMLEFNSNSNLLGSICKCETSTEALKQQLQINDDDDFDIIPIVADVTPACTYLKIKANDGRTMLNGFIIKKCLSIKNKINKNVFKSDQYSKDYFIDIDGDCCCLILDFLQINFRNQNDVGLTPMYRLKNEYRLSIQQRYTGFLSRAGDSIIK